MANPAFCFTETEEFHHRCANFVICQAGNDEFWSDFQKKKGQNLFGCTICVVFGLKVTQNALLNRC